VRLGALLLWVAAVAAAYVVLRLVSNLVFGPVAGIGTVLLIVAAVAVAQPLAWLGERQLVARWPSGRSLSLASGSLVWRERGQSTAFDLRQLLNFMRWRFAVRRRRGGRVPAGHHCFAVRLVQGDNVVSLYAFLAPDAAEALAGRYAFFELRPAGDKDKPALGGREAQYLSAENDRWESGAELDPADFQALLEHLAAYQADFGRAPASALPA
jgi:hypothetical protein